MSEVARGRRAIADSVNAMRGLCALSVGEIDMPTPPGWRWVKLTDVARLESGHTPSRQHPEYWDGDIPWIGIPDARVHHGRRIDDTHQKVTEAGIANSAARILPTGTVCLSRTASVGYVTIMGRPMATSQDFVNWVCGPELDPEFLRHLLLAEKGSLLSFGKGSTHTTIYFPEVQAFRICIPDRDAQASIVKHLDGCLATTKRAKTALDEVPALVDRLRQSILAAAFRGDLTADWRAENPDVEPASELLKRIRIERRRRWEEAELAKMIAKGKAPKDDRWKAKYEEPEPVDESGLPELPERWCWASLSELVAGDAALCYGVVQPGEDDASGVPLIRVQDLFSKALSPSLVRKVSGAVDSEYSRSRVAAGDVLVSVVGTIGRVAVVPSSLDGANVARAVARVRSCTSIPTHWLAEALSDPSTQTRLGGGAREVARKTLNIDVLSRTPVPIAPTPEIEQIVCIVAGLRARAQRLLETAQVLSQLPISCERHILERAFSGRGE